LWYDLTTKRAQIQKKIQIREKQKDSRIRFVKQREKLSKYLHAIADLSTGTAVAHGTSANKNAGGLSVS